MVVHRPSLLLLLLALLLPSPSSSGGWLESLSRGVFAGSAETSHPRVDASCPGAAGCGDERELAPHINDLRRYGNDHIHEELLQRFDASGDRRVSVAEAARQGLGKLHFAYYDTAPTDGALSYGEWTRCARELVQYADADLSQPPPPGHLQPLGRHGTPAPFGQLADLLEFSHDTPLPVHPRRFWREQVAAHRPALLRGAGKFSPAAKRWTEDFLLKQHGNVAVKVEPAQEARGSIDAYDRLHERGIPDSGRMALRELLTLPTEAGAYGVTILPQAMAWDVAVPPSVLCGGRRQRLPKRGDDADEGSKVPHPYPHPQAPWM